MRLTNRGKIFFTALAIIVLTIIVIIIAVSGGKANRDMQVSACDQAEAYVYRGDRSFVVNQGLKLESGDRISVKEGQITIDIDGKSSVVLYGDTNVSIEATGEADKGTLTVDMSKGEMLLVLGTDIGQSTYIVTSDSATISAEGGSVFSVGVDAMTDYESTMLHVLSSTVSLKLTATKLNAEVTQAVPSGYIMTTSKIATTGKCQIEANNLGNVSLLSQEAAKSIHDLQEQGKINTIYSQSALMDRLGQEDTPTQDLPTQDPTTDDPTQDLPTQDPTTDDPTLTPPPGVIITPGDTNCTHDYVKDDRQSKEATCVADGYIYYACSKCQRSYLETVPKSQGQHAFDSGVHTTGDCTTPGYTTYTCANCRQTKVENDATAADHTYDNGVHTAGDCTKFGYTTYTCTKCQETKVVNDTSKGSHNYKDEHVTAVNCLETDYTIHTCQVCDDRKVTIGAAGAHSYVDHVCQYCYLTEPGYEQVEPTPEPDPEPTPDAGEGTETEGAGQE